MSEHFFNTAGLRPWGGLKPPVSGERADIRILGVPLDRGSLYRPGAAKAPAELRKLSAIFAPVSENAELFDSATIQDDGDLTLVDGDMGANVDAVAAAIEQTPAGATPIVLGGDHTAASPTLVAQQRRFNGQLSILYIDAHPDLNDVSRDSRWSNGSALRRGLELGDIDPRKVTLLGCRDYDWEEVEFIRKMGITLINAATAHRWTGNQLADEIGSRIGSDALHVSLDIDSLDPSIAPGTGVPSSGGLTSRELLDLLHQLRGVRLAGLDVDEVAPPLDVGHVTSLAALKFIFEFIGMVKLAKDR
ncbi:MAG TPA: arginase family protein [Candidatus Dormibacteraeota bacterium]|nr:arginase family protein [Candidatus Dormibacteraeota bacterium]